MTDTAILAAIAGGVIGAASGTLGAWLTAKATKAAAGAAADATRQAASAAGRMQAAALFDSQFQQWQRDARTSVYSGVVASFRALMTSWWTLLEARRKDIEFRDSLHKQVTISYASFNSELGRAQLLTADSVLDSIVALSAKMQEFDEIAERMDFVHGQRWSKEADEKYDKARQSAEVAAKDFIRAAREELGRSPHDDNMDNAK